ncbi:hypothetical protein [Kribbella swartbergensis]
MRLPTSYVLRRRTFTAALASTMLAGAVPAYAHRGDLTLKLPAPTGRWKVGTTTRHLIDRDRSDPWMARLIGSTSCGITAVRTCPEVLRPGADR